MDGGFQLVELINTEQFGIYHYRLTNPLTQLLPLFAIKMEWSLKLVMQLYSLNFILLFALLYHLIVCVGRNDYLALTQIAFFSFFVSDTFYFVTPEFYQGMSLLLLWFAIALRFDFKTDKWLFLVLLFLLVFIVFDHLLLSGFFLLMWLFFALQQPQMRTWQYFALLLGLFIIFGIHKAYYTSWYDAMKQKEFWANINQYYPNFFEIPAWNVFLQKCTNRYILFPVVLISLVIGYAVLVLNAFQNKVKQSLFDTGKSAFGYALRLGLLLGFCGMYLLIIHIGDPFSPYIFYAEVNYMGLAIPLCIAFFFEMKRFISERILLFSLLGIMLFRLFSIVNVQDKFVDRHTFLETKMSNNEGTKLLLPLENAPLDLLIQDWAIPEETLLLSAMNGADNAKSILIPTEEKQYQPYLNDKNIWLEKGRQVPQKEMNVIYFNLGEGVYRFVE